MEAQELRIGNWIADRGLKEWQIDHWESMNKVSAKPNTSMCNGILMETHPLTEYVDYLKPIQLTEEWMTKFGFKQVGINFEKGWLLLWKNKSLDTIDFVVNEPYSGKRFARHLRYVHELQNIYQGLNGVELTLERPQTSQPIN